MLVLAVLVSVKAVSDSPRVVLACSPSNKVASTQLNASPRARQVRHRLLRTNTNSLRDKGRKDTLGILKVALRATGSTRISPDSSRGTGSNQT